MERSTEDRGALLNTGLSTEDVAFDVGRNCQLKAERLTEGVTVNSRLNAQRKAGRSTQDLELDRRRNVLVRIRSLDALLWLEPLDSLRSSLSFVTRRLTLSSILCR